VHDPGQQVNRYAASFIKARSLSTNPSRSLDKMLFFRELIPAVNSCAIPESNMAVIANATMTSISVKPDEVFESVYRLNGG
jgi:hypothetical protein